MGIRQDQTTELWIASFSKRHPVTRMPVSLRRKNLKSKAEAVKVERELILDVEQRLRKTAIPSWSDAVTSFLRECHNRGITPNTIDDYSTGLKAHTSEWNDRCIDSISSLEIRELIRKNVGHRSPSHQKNILKFIRGVFNFSVETGSLSKNPTPSIKFKIGDKIRKVLNENEVKTLLNKAKLYSSEWYPHWTLALYTGMRNGELYALTWNKVDFDAQTLTVDSSWNNKDGFKCTKSGDDRILSIPGHLVAFLKELKLKNVDSAFVLPRIDRWEKGEQARELRMFLEGINLPQVKFHDLRATWATMLLSKGVEPIKVMKAGGWKDLKTMMIYARKSGIDIQGMSDCLDFHTPSFDPNDMNAIELGDRSDL